MTGKNVTRADLAQALAYALGLPRHEAVVLAEQVLTEICNTLERGENVKLSGFGNFVVRKKAQRVGRNPKTGAEVPIEPRRVVTFTPSHKLKDRVNGDPVSA
ncbi:integration host factor subunit alpha [Microvirga calopogonii]|uniref:integration host factor subunit alpha n=1 Tax=Microvirga calopogonii TaxID=2078013 RepID=UPI000E0D2F11|nr:integration host factor subunit alpha [Microvirga calopogonii]